MDTIYLLYLIRRVIEGDFKWSFVGAICFGLGLLISKLIEPYIKQKWLRPVLAGVIVALFVWYGHMLVDPYIHSVESWWVTPLAEHMDLEIP